MRRRDFHQRLLGLAASSASISLAGGAATAKAAPLSLVATTGMIADTARRIGGSSVQVRGLMRPGVDPHAYRQTRSDILALNRAELILWNGLYLEAQFEELMAQLAKRRRVVAVAEAVPVASRLSHEDYADRYDPHVWMDPSLWRLVAERLCGALVDAAPARKSEFLKNHQSFDDSLKALLTYSEEVLTSVPAESRVLVTAHDAFNYFGAAYGFEVIGVQGISTESEAGVARIRELANMLVRRRIGSVFVESSVSDRSMRALIEGASAQGHKVSVGGELFSDAMGPEGSYEGTYLGMIDHNVTTIARSLGGKAPVRGRLGRLRLKDRAI